MTWFPLQAALKMSTLPGAIRATLDALLDHINPAPEDPTRPDTLIVWESRARLAAETGFSEVTTRDHLQRLRGEKDLRKGQRVMVLQRIEDAGSHRAARYELLPAALDALVDPARLQAFEEHPPREGHPYHRWRQWRAAQMAQAEVGESALPQAPETESLGVSSLSPDHALGESSFPQLGKASSPELPQVDLVKEELTTAPTILVQSAGKAKDRSPATAPPLPEWRTTDGIYGEHRRCGTCHRRDQPCPWFAWEERAAGVGPGGRASTDPPRGGGSPRRAHPPRRAPQDPRVDTRASRPYTRADASLRVMSPHWSARCTRQGAHRCGLPAVPP